MLRAINSIRTGDRVTDSALDALQKGIEDARACVLLDGLLLEDVDVSAGGTRIQHRLGRAPLGYLVVAQDAAATFYESAARDERFLTLTSSGAVTASLWVF